MLAVSFYSLKFTINKKMSEHISPEQTGNCSEVKFSDFHEITVWVQPRPLTDFFSWMLEKYLFRTECRALLSPRGARGRGGDARPTFLILSTFMCCMTRRCGFPQMRGFTQPLAVCFCPASACEHAPTMICF